ncbi:hypothetical protein [Microbacterium sp. T32]|uniref:hypothetical protein n=1 Tax=Microbacterium sp. T32 TaxID=1776083 RepID=UPI0007AB335F|nr:hypothetical protein [Microbacterium sp. T32]KZE41204.1 hypothetical protein AVW09_00975 [Microbacterium sp. T32]
MPQSRSTDTPASDAGATDEGTHPRPSRLVPFLVYGSISAALLAIGEMTLRDDDPAVAAVGDFCCLGGCLSGVAAAIFGTVTLSRAMRARDSGAGR